MKKTKKTKICYVLSYKDPNYIRTRVLIKALELNDNIELYKAINTTKSIRRYFQTLWFLLKTRIQNNPDMYILGFRGHDIFWGVRLLTIGKPLVFDEFINADDWLTGEQGKFKKDSLIAKFARVYVKLVLLCSHIILTDTKLGSKSSSETYGINIKKYQHIYVGEDSDLFFETKSKKRTNNFTVFFYGNMAPLHGIEYILEAAKKLKKEDIFFEIVGGKGHQKTVDFIREYIRKNNLARVKYSEWADLEILPKLTNRSELCLSGPFGNTSQSKRVITGKTYQFLASGRPTIVGMIQEDAGFIDKKNCLLVQQGSSKAIADAITWAFNSRKKLEKIGVEGNRLFKDRFSVEHISSQLNDILGIAI